MEKMQAVIVRVIFNSRKIRFAVCRDTSSSDSIVPIYSLDSRMEMFTSVAEAEIYCSSINGKNIPK